MSDSTLGPDCGYLLSWPCFCYDEFMRYPEDILEQDEILFGCNGGKLSYLFKRTIFMLYYKYLLFPMGYPSKILKDDNGEFNDGLTVVFSNRKPTNIYANLLI